MPTITVDVSEKIGSKIASIPESQRDAWICEVLADTFNDEADSPLSGGEITAIKEGISKVFQM